MTGKESKDDKAKCICVSKCDDKCRWCLSDEEPGIWTSDCGVSHAFYEDSGGPRDNLFEWCPFCGRKLIEKN